MTDNTTTETAPEEAAPAPTATEILAGELKERFGAGDDPYDLGNQSVVIDAHRLIESLRWLRDERDMCILVDIVGIDYLAYPGHRNERFAVAYLLKGLEGGKRIRLKVFLDEEEPEVASAAGLWKNANWFEREVWDQYGIVFTGHPNLKRLLNHHEFVGHPLRKDYPVQKRQHLSINDPMIDELVDELELRGYQVVERPTASETGQTLSGDDATGSPQREREGDQA